MAETFIGTWVKQYPPGVGTKFLDGLGLYDNVTPSTDLASSDMDDGELIIGDTGGVPIISTLTAGTGVTITNAAGSITIAASGVDAGCDVYNSATQSVNDATDTALTFDTETRDTDAFHSTASNTGRITIPAGQGGWYMFGAHVPWTGSSTGDRKIWFRTNGTTASTPVTWDLSLGGFNHEIVQPLYLAAGDYVEVMVHQTSGGALNVLANARFWALKMGGLPIAVMGQVQNCRLTLLTADPHPSADQTAKTTVYLTPFGGNSITLMDSSGNAQTPVALAEISLAVPATTVTLYYMYVYSNSGTLTLEASTTAFALHTNGLPFKTGDKTRLYVGQIRTTGVSGECEDSQAKRFCVNYWNRRRRTLFCNPGYADDDSATGITNASATFIRVNGGTNDIVEFLCVDAGEPVDVTGCVLADPAASEFVIFAIGIDSTSSATIETISGAGIRLNGSLTWSATMTAGYHYYQMLGASSSGTATFYADNSRRGSAADPRMTYLKGHVMG